MKKIYSLALIMFFLASVSASLAQERERHYPRRPGPEPAIPASVRESNTRNPAASAGNSTTRLRTQSNGRARTQQASMLTTATNYYVRDDEPWGSQSNINALDNALGAGNWSPVTFSDPDVLTIFDPSTNFIFLEGSDGNALELNDFLVANLATIESWVSNGGRLLLNAAPNEGGDMDFGFNGTILNYNHGQSEVHVVGPLFANPNVLSASTYYGGSFSHAHITGNGIAPLILGADDEILVLGEKLHGDGLVVFGGMTQSTFHNPQPDADNLMTNIIYYLSNNNIESSLPEANFFGSQTSVVTNRTVAFLDISTGYPTDRTWTIAPSTFEYAEGTNEHSNRIKLKFTEPGTYTIKLTVSNAAGQDEFIKADIAVRSPYNFYWVGGSGNWSEHETHWAKSSGGTEFHDILPTEDDNVFFDENSFTTDDEIVDMEDNEIFASNANFTGVTHLPELANGTLYLSGSLAAPDPMKFSGWSFVLTSSESETIDISGVQFPNDDHGISINGKGSFEVMAPFTNDGYFEIENGAITTNGHTISVTDFYLDSEGSNTPIIDFENSELHVSNYFSAYYDDVYPFIGSIKLFFGKVGDDAYFESADNITIDEITLVGGAIEFGNNITIGKLTVMPGTEFGMDDSDEFTVGSIDIRGTAGENITISNCTINKASGTVVGEYLILSNVIATGEASFYADKNSTDNGGNDGWIFSTKETQNITFGELSTKHFGDTDFDLTASSSSGLTIAFEVVSGPATLSGNTVTITGVGEVTVRALQEGDDDFTPAQDVLQSFVVEKAAQAITFNPPANKTFGDTAFDLTATGGASENAISFSITSGPATVSGNTVTITGAGVIVVKASQAGNNNYNAEEVSKEIAVAKAAQTITFNPPANKTFGDAAFTLSATGGASENAIIFSVVSGPATIVNGSVTINGAGVIVVKAAQAGNSNYDAAEVSKEVAVAKAAQTITFTTITTKTFGDVPFAVSATGGASGNAVTFDVVSGAATIAGNTVTINAAGPVTVKASQTGNENYLASTAEQTFCVNPAKPAITVSALDTEAPVLTASTADDYQWYNNGVAISGATGKTFTPSTGGVYTVVTKASTCASVASNAEVLIITGLEADLETFVSTYPNPVVNELIIDMTAINVQHEASVVLYDAAGKTMTSTKAKGSVSIPMATYNPGRYVVVVSFGKQRIAKNIIKK